MADKQQKEQLKRTSPRRAEHLKKHRWKKGQSGNPKGRPKGAVGLTKRIEEKLLESFQGDDSQQLADLLAAAIVKAMLKDPLKAERLISRFMDRDEGPVERGNNQLIQIGIDASNTVPQPPPLSEAGSDGAPPLAEHLKRLVSIAGERGLAGIAEILPSAEEAEEADIDQES